MAAGDDTELLEIPKATFDALLKKQSVAAFKVCHNIAILLAERLRLSFGSEPFVMGSSSAMVTISAGISGTELAEFATFDALLDSSDQALYGAKRAGKNCVYTYAGPSRP